MKILILGGTKGLGYEIASQFSVNNRNQIYVVGRTCPQTLSANMEWLESDLSSTQSIKKLSQWIDDNDIDQFYWVSGILLKGELAKQNSAEIEKVIDVNFRNSVLLAHKFWQKSCYSNKKKNLIVISSSSGIKARNDEAIYVATKFAQVGFTRSLGMENQNSDLKISLFLPGGMKTPFWDSENLNSDVLNSFLDPKKVADKILKSVKGQSESFLELEIPRGSL